MPSTTTLRVLLRLLALGAPFLFTALFGWLLMEGHIDFGGGDKDIFLMVPLLLWSLAYFLGYALFWWRRVAPGRAVAFSSTLATGVLAVAWVILVVARH